MLGGYDRTLYQSERLHATAPTASRSRSRSSTARARPRDGRAPLLLYGYGSYGFPLPGHVLVEPPEPARPRRRVRHRPHPRRRRDGQGLARRRPHDEEEEHVHRLHRRAPSTWSPRSYTAAERLVIEGGSAGGLLMGAVANMRPDLFKAVVSKVPFVDVINTMLDASLPLTVGEYEEWGNPKQEGRVRLHQDATAPTRTWRRKAYPAMLVKTSFNDSQVMYWEPAKYVARLRTLKTDAQPAAAEDEHGRGPRRRLRALRLPARGRVRLRVHPGPARYHGLTGPAELRRRALGGRARARSQTLLNPATEEPLAARAADGIDRARRSRTRGRSAAPRCGR